MGSTSPGLWPGLECALCAHGPGGVACDPRVGLAARSAGHRTVRAAIGPERALDLALLSMARGMACICGDPRALGASAVHHSGILARTPTCRGPPAAVPRVGHLCGGADLRRLALQSEDVVGRESVPALWAAGAGFVIAVRVPTSDTATGWSAGSRKARDERAGDTVKPSRRSLEKVR